MANCLIGNPFWQNGGDKEYECKCCGNKTWFDEFELKRLVEEYGYDEEICCGQECSDKMIHLEVPEMKVKTFRNINNGI